MNLSKLLIAVVSCTCISGCKSKKSIPTQSFNTQLLENKIGTKPAIFLSCIRCGCVVEELNNIYVSNPELLEKFDFFADSNCIKEVIFPKQVQNSPQSLLDSVYDENYSILLFKREGKNITARLIKTEESKKIKQMLKSF